MDKSSRRSVRDRPSVVKEMHQVGLSSDILDESVIDRTLHSSVSQSETFSENLVDSGNEVHMVGHRSNACGSCRSSNNVNR